MQVPTVQSAISNAVQGLQKASKDLSDVAQAVAESGADGLSENLDKVIGSETSFKANAAVLSAAERTTGRLIDILV